MTLTQLGNPLGIRTAQGTQDLIDRLDALLRYDRPDEQLTRQARRLATKDGQDERITWIAQHADELRAVAAVLITQAERWNVTDRDWLDELAADLTDDHITPATMAVLGLATAEVRTAPGVLVLGGTHRVHRVLATADQLRTGFARLAP